MDKYKEITMKKILPAFLGTLAAACCICGTLCLSACGNDEQRGSDGLEYALADDGKSYYLSGYTEDAPEDIVVASEYKGLPVTAIGDGALITVSDDETHLPYVIKSVVVPSSVKEIYSFAFKNYTIESVTLSEGLEVIADYAFDACTHLKTLNIPSTVKEIGIRAFGYCDIESIAIPEGITEIKENTFYACSYLKNVTLPQSLTAIGKGAFQQTGITQITLPESLTSIGDGAFMSSQLTSIDIPAGVTYIGQSAFAVTPMKSVTIPQGITVIESNTFSGMTNLESVTLPQSITEIKYAAFQNCLSLKTIYFEGTEQQFEAIIKSEPLPENVVIEYI